MKSLHAASSVSNHSFRRAYEVPPIYIRFWNMLSYFHIKFCCDSKFLSNFTYVDFDYIYLLDYAGKEKKSISS